MNAVLQPRHGWDHDHRSTAGTLIDPQQPAAWSALDREPFDFRHRLAHHPLFELPRLAELSRKLLDQPDHGRYFEPHQRTLGRAERERLLAQSILDLGTTRRWLAIHFANELDPAYAQLYEQLLHDIEVASGFPLRSRMSWGAMTVFMNSPHLQVPYHFDHETNFLLQVRGEKVVHLFPSDRSVLTEREIEDFYRHNPIAGRYREETLPKARRFVLTPGVGVHHPPLAPHMIRNGADVSVSVSIYYTLPHTDDRAHVYQANFALRLLGLRPRPPGVSPRVDRAKVAVMRALSTTRPQTHDDVLYSGVGRLAAPLALAKRCIQGARARLRAPV